MLVKLRENLDAVRMINEELQERASLYVTVRTARGGSRGAFEADLRGNAELRSFTHDLQRALETIATTPPMPLPSGLKKVRRRAVSTRWKRRKLRPGQHPLQVRCRAYGLSRLPARLAESAAGARRVYKTVVASKGPRICRVAGQIGARRSLSGARKRRL